MPDGNRAFIMSQFFTLGHLNQLIVDNLHKIRQIPFDIIIHLPRSGTIPASLLATYLCKPLQSIDEYCANIPLIIRKSDTTNSNRILVVDDSINLGIQLKAAVERIKLARPESEIKTLCIYDNKSGRGERIFNCDYHLFKHKGMPYFMPWFLWKSSVIENAVLDFDGVMCRDCLDGENDDAEGYAGFLSNSDLKFKPLRHKIGAIVTGRLEKYRLQTEVWLKQHGIKYNQLIMCPAKNNAERKALKVSEWKGKIYKNLPQVLFIESSAREAPIIAATSGKMVYCIDNSEVYK